MFNNSIKKHSFKEAKATGFRNPAGEALYFCGVCDGKGCEGCGRTGQVNYDTWAMQYDNEHMRRINVRKSIAESVKKEEEKQMQFFNAFGRMPDEKRVKA